MNVKKYFKHNNPIRTTVPIEKTVEALRRRPEFLKFHDMANDEMKLNGSG